LHVNKTEINAETTPTVVYGSLDLIEVFKIYKGFTRLSIDELFERDANTKGTRQHTLRLKKKQGVKDVRRVVNRWNSLDQESRKPVDTSSINSFKGRLDKIRKTRFCMVHKALGLMEMGPREATQVELQGELLALQPHTRRLQ